VAFICATPAAMNIETHQIKNTRIAELMAPGILIRQAEEGVDIFGNLYYQQYDSVIIHEKNLNPAFFDLSTGMAGELLQKFSNFKMKLAIVGDFSKYENKNLKDFINESNKAGKINFVGTTAEALQKLSAN
jgi:hypothetical protein